jgi:hypothetical protein
VGVKPMMGTKRWRLPPRDQTGEHPSQPRATIASGVLLTLVAWLLSRLTVGAAWGQARNPFSFNPNLWTRWDSFNYATIAMHGRTFGRCRSPRFSALPNPLHMKWCGTAGWLPGYPWLIRAVNLSGIALPKAALLISWIGLATAMFLVWLGWGRDLPLGRALVLLLLFGLFPGAVYNFALFPTSVALACVVGALLAAMRERFLTAALLMFFAGLCYPSSWFAALGLAVGLVLIALPLGEAAIVRRALWGLAGLASLLVLGLHDQFAYGHADAYLLMDSQRGLDAKGFPGQDFLRLIFTQNTVEQKLIGRFGGAVLAVQGAVAVSLSGAAAVVAALAWRRKGRDPALLYPALVGIAVVLSVLLLAANGGAWNRSVVLAAPCVICLRRVPLPVLCAIVAVVGITTALISRSFFVGSLV